MPVPAPSPLARLVVFITCLALAGSFVAGAHFVAVDLPEQMHVQAPTNHNSNIEWCNNALHMCSKEGNRCWECVYYLQENSHCGVNSGDLLVFCGI
jgi:hypothetical protein